LKLWKYTSATPVQWAPVTNWGVELRDRLAIGTHEICRQHKIVNIPFLAIYRDGSLVGTVTGLHKQKILERLAELVAVYS